MFSFIVWLNLAQHASFLLAVWRYVTAECAQTKDTNGFQRAFNPHRLGRQLFTLVSFTLEPLGGSRKFVKHVLCRTQIKIPRLLAFWVQCRSRCSNDLLQPKISPKLSYYKCPAKPESLLNFPKARFLQQSDRLSLIDIYKNSEPWLRLLDDDKAATNSHQANHSRAAHYRNRCCGIQ